MPSFSNQIAPFSDEKAQSHYPYGSGPIPQHDYARDYGNDYQGHAPQHRAERGHDHDRELSDSKSSADEARGHKDRKHGAHKSDDKHGRGLRGLTDEQRSLGASMLGGAGGALIGHKLGGTLGAIGGILVGAIGATKLEEKREERKYREKNELKHQYTDRKDEYTDGRDQYADRRDHHNDGRDHHTDRRDHHAGGRDHYSDSRNHYTDRLKSDQRDRPASERRGERRGNRSPERYYSSDDERDSSREPRRRR